MEKGSLCLETERPQMILWEVVGHQNRVFKENMKMKLRKIITAAAMLTLVLGLILGQVGSAKAATITANVAEDGYFMGNFNNWYITSPYAKAYTYIGDHDGDPNTPEVDLTIQGYFKYDLSSLSGISANDVTSASMNFYLRDKGGMGPAPIAVGAAGTLQVDPYATAPDFTPYAGSRGTLAPGYTASQSVSPTVDVTTGGTELISLDITNIVKGWLSGSLANFGVEMIYPELNTDDAFYWATMEGGAATSPFLQVETAAVPIPAAAWLLGSGLLGMIGVRRRQKMS